MNVAPSVVRLRGKWRSSIERHRNPRLETCERLGCLNSCVGRACNEIAARIKFPGPARHLAPGRLNARRRKDVVRV